MAKLEVVKFCDLASEFRITAFFDLSTVFARDGPRIASGRYAF